MQYCFGTPQANRKQEEKSLYSFEPGLGCIWGAFKLAREA